MFYHSKELQFKARVSRPDPRFARLIMGLYNKIVKTEGHDRPESGTDRLNRII